MASLAISAPIFQKITLQAPVHKHRNSKMIKKVVSIKNLGDKNLILDDLKYWLSKPSKERIAAVEYLRRQYHGDTARLQRVARVIQRT
jgi:hypothetical protein